MLTLLAQSDINLSEEVREILHIAGRKAEEYLHAAYGAPHLLWALLSDNSSTNKLIQTWGKDIYYLQEWATVRLEEYPKTNGAAAHAAADSGVGDVFVKTDQLRFELSREKVDAVCLLAALCTPGLAFTHDQLKTFSLSKKEILDGINGANTSIKAAENNVSVPRLTGGVSSDDALPGAYCLDMHSRATGQNHFRLVGRQEEITTCLEVLSRYTKTNLLVTGKSGVGKSALIAGLADQVADKKVPVNLLKARMLELDVAALQAGVRYKGELEDRFQKILKALHSCEKAILVIEDIHILLSKRQKFSSLASLLVMELGRGDLTVIGTTTPENYRKNIERNERFMRYFELLELDEPDDTMCARIIGALKAPHERHHGVRVTEGSVRKAIRLARRYDQDRCLPDAAIDLIDRCMARTRITLDRAQISFDRLSDEFEQYDTGCGNENLTKVRERYSVFYKAANRFIRDHCDFCLEKEKELNEDDHFYGYLAKLIPRLEAVFEHPTEEINSADLARVISRKTGIPTGKIQARERKRLLGMEEVLRERVVGQDAALKSVSEAVRESRSGLLEKGQPIGSFFLLGPTGTGKTELAKALSEFLFQNEQAMIRFDMSEFKEEHSAALLHGAPPGYVGYEEGGMLVNKIRERPYSVVLFDEIEKAHASVFDIFLQILDEGRLHDRLGREGEFSHSVILFTSNIGSEQITRLFEEEDRLPSGQKLMELLSGYFRPEFLGRLTEVVPFAPIGEGVLLRIFDIHLNDLQNAAGRKGIAVAVDPKTKTYLSRLGYSPKYGARPLKGVIRDKIRRPLSRLIIEERVGSGDKVQLSLDENRHIQWNIN